ncbi:MAG: efflux transporter outer membrane subunit [Magnetospirillum sp.]|nr:efflux transporter outer membrane subunit [Magnetospirillum sp.]
MTRKAASMAAAMAGVALMAACSVGPDYERPPVTVPAAYKEATAQGGWKPGVPQDDIDRGAWWSIFNDPLLDSLERKIDVSNQNLKAAAAAYQQARAVVNAARAGYFPTLGGSGSVLRSQSGIGSFSTGSAPLVSPPAQTTFDVSGDAIWELDVWGRIRRIVESEVANAQASAADLASARLSLQATLAADYFSLRIQDELRRLLDSTVVAYTQALEITQNQVVSGVAPPSDVEQAKTQLETTRSQAIAVGIFRAQLEHAIAVLIGAPPAEFSIEPVKLSATVPGIPPAVPSTLLERRPDIAAAERRMASANAQIGVAIAAYYPTLSLSAALSYAGPSLGNLFQTANRVWSVGPQLAETLFDGGLRNAQVEEARAAYDQEVALYRQTVLTGFQQVEDQLAGLRILAQQAEVEAAAVEAAQRAESMILNQYEAGTVAYTSVITAQTAALANEQTAITVLGSRLTSTVGLIQALGGGWDAASLPTAGSIGWKVFP